MLDDMLSAVANEHRRRILGALIERGPSGTVKVPEDVHEGDVALEELQTALYHTHLPLLEAEGYVDWDRDRHQVTRGPEFDRIALLIDLLEEYRRELVEN